MTTTYTPGKFLARLVDIIEHAHKAKEGDNPDAAFHDYLLDHFEVDDCARLHATINETRQLIARGEMLEGTLEILRRRNYTSAIIAINPDETGRYTVYGAEPEDQPPATPDDGNVLNLEPFTVDLDTIPRLYATGDVVIKTAVGWVHIIRGEPEKADGPLRAEPPNPTPDIVTDLAIRHNGGHLEILGHLGRSFTVAYRGNVNSIPDNAWTKLR